MISKKKIKITNIENDLTDIKQDKIVVKLDEKFYKCELFGYRFWENSERTYPAVKIDNIIYAVGVSSGISSIDDLFYYSISKWLCKDLNKA